LPRELLVLSDIRGHHPPDLSTVQQLAKSPTVHAAVVRDDFKIVDAGLQQSRDQHAWDTAQPEAANGERGS
jgi:hypothetical protein